jgi:Zn-dependent peptidase ImmA (M78 family)
VIEAMQVLEEDFTLRLAQRYANKFKVSKYVIARCMFDLKRVDPGTYWSQIDAWRDSDAGIAAGSEKKRGRPDFVGVRVSHAGRRYVATVVEALNRKILTSYEASKILALRPEHLEKAQLLAG